MRRLARRVTVLMTTAVWLLVAALTDAQAAGASSPVLGAPPPSDPNYLNEVIKNLTTVLQGLAAGLATLFLVVGGLLWLLAGGDPEQVTRSKRALMGAAIGYGIAILAFVITNILKTKVLGV